MSNLPPLFEAVTRFMFPPTIAERTLAVAEAEHAKPELARIGYVMDLGEHPVPEAEVDSADP